MLNLAIIKQSLQISLQNIKSNKMRSFLTMLGIVIGVGAVIGLITIVQIVSSTVMGELTGLGAGTVTVYAYASATKLGLTDNDVRILSQLEGVKGVSPVAYRRATTVAYREVYERIPIMGRSEMYFIQDPDMIAAGRGLTAADMDGNTYVCVVDRGYISKALVGKQVLGSKILINGVEYTIVGIIKEDDSLMAYMTDPGSSDGMIYVPYRNVLSMEGKSIIYNLDVYTEEGADISMVESSLKGALSNMYNNDDDAYEVVNMESLNSMMDQVKGLMSAMLGGIASISLLVGGIGIMNMMLVSVSERTKEIGLRKALGAEPARIQLQFLIESIVLSVIGGLIGVAIGLLIAYVASLVMSAKFSISLSAIALGVGFSAGVGIIFGWVPAKRASELNPIDALRAE